VKLQKWALISEIVGGVAIVVTLAILIIQIRGNTAAIQAQTLGAHLDGERRRREWLFLNEGGIADLVLMGQDGKELSRQEKWRLDRYYDSILDSAEWQFGEVQAGRLPDSALSTGTWQAMWNTQPIFRERLEARKYDLSPAFSEFWEQTIIIQ